jgi:hypothetical protein
VVYTPITSLSDIYFQRGRIGLCESTRLKGVIRIVLRRRSVDLGLTCYQGLQRLHPRLQGRSTTVQKKYKRRGHGPEPRNENNISKGGSFSTMPALYIPTLEPLAMAGRLPENRGHETVQAIWELIKYPPLAAHYPGPVWQERSNPLAHPPHRLV